MMRNFRYLEVYEDGEKFLATRGISGSEELLYKCGIIDGEFTVEVRVVPPPDIKISKNGFSDYFAHAMYYGIYDINYSGESLYSGWNRIPDEHSVLIKKSYPYSVELKKSFNFWNGYSRSNDKPKDLLVKCRDVFDDSIIDKVKGHQGCSCEFSGGVDSSIVLTALLKISNIDVWPVTVQYPFFEFKNEKLFQDKLIDHLKIKTNLLDFNSCFPYFGMDEIPKFIAPSMASTSFGFFSEVKKTRDKFFISGPHFNGHGGDRLFSTSPFDNCQPSLEEKPDWLGKKVFESIKSKINVISFNENAREPGWNVAMIDPPWATKLLNNSISGSAYLSKEFIYILRNIWESDVKFYEINKKIIANNVFSDRLPSFLWDRTYKTDHIGTAYRGAIKNREYISKLINENMEFLSDLGIDSFKFRAESINVTNGIQSATRSWGIVISVLAWFRSQYVK